MYQKLAKGRTLNLLNEVVGEKPFSKESRDMSIGICIALLCLEKDVDFQSPVVVKKVLEETFSRRFRDEEIKVVLSNLNKSQYFKEHMLVFDGEVTDPLSWAILANVARGHMVRVKGD